MNKKFLQMGVLIGVFVFKMRDQDWFFDLYTVSPIY